jgi:hypothetical protein
MTLLAGPGRTAGHSATVVGAPCFSRGEVDFSPAEKRLFCKEWALARGFFDASAKAQDKSRTLSRNAEALLPSAKAEGSHHL